MARGTKGVFHVGKLAAAGNITASSGVSAQALAATQGVSAGSAGFTVSSLSLCMARVPIQAGTTGIRTYAFAFPAGAVVDDVFLDIATAESTGSTKTMEIGPAGTTSGFLTGISVASANTIRGIMTAGSRTVGSLFLDSTAASGVNRIRPVIPAAAALVSTVPNAMSELAGDICVLYYVVG